MSKVYVCQRCHNKFYNPYDGDYIYKCFGKWRNGGGTYGSDREWYCKSCVNSAIKEKNAAIKADKAAANAESCDDTDSGSASSSSSSSGCSTVLTGILILLGLIVILGVIFGKDPEDVNNKEQIISIPFAHCIRIRKGMNV